VSGFTFDKTIGVNSFYWLSGNLTIWQALWTMKDTILQRKVPRGPTSGKLTPAKGITYSAHNSSDLLRLTWSWKRLTSVYNAQGWFIKFLEAFCKRESKLGAKKKKKKKTTLPSGSAHAPWATGGELPRGDACALSSTRPLLPLLPCIRACAAVNHQPGSWGMLEFVVLFVGSEGGGVPFYLETPRTWWTSQICRPTFDLIHSSELKVE
jgi:hypothetical protein